MPNRRNVLYCLMIISLLTGLFSGKAPLFHFTYLIAALLIASRVWTWLSLRSLRLFRVTRASRAQVGRDFRESFRLEADGMTPRLWLEVQDHSTLPGHHASQVVPALAGRGRYAWEAETTCVVRGEFQLGPLSVVSGDPFGFFRAVRKLGVVEKLTVYPMTVEITKVQLPVGILSGGDAQRQLTHAITTNASSIREYVPGDSISRIHWRSTARTGNLMVKEFERDPLVDIWLLCDFSKASVYEDAGLRRSKIGGHVIPDRFRIPPSTEEYGVIAAASLAKHFINSERVVGYAAYAPWRQYIQPDRGNRQLSRILGSLAIARSESTRSLKEMLSLETPHFTRGTTLMIVTSTRDTGWIAEAQVLMRRGVKPICVYVDPQTFHPALDSTAARGTMQLAKIPTLLIGKGDDLAAALEARPI